MTITEYVVIDRGELFQGGKYLIHVLMTTVGGGGNASGKIFGQNVNK